MDFGQSVRFTDMIVALTLDVHVQKIFQCRPKIVAGDYYMRKANFPEPLEFKAVMKFVCSIYFWEEYHPRHQPYVVGAAQKKG